MMQCTPFSQHVASLGKGTIDAELTELLADVVKSVRETGKQGTVSLQLKIGMLNKRDENAVKITPSITHKAPKLDCAETILWSTADGDMLRDDPEQMKLELKTIETPKQTLKKIGE